MTTREVTAALLVALALGSMLATNCDAQRSLRACLNVAVDARPPALRFQGAANAPRG